MVWNSYAQDGSRGGIFAQRYDTEGQRLGAELQVNSYTSEAQHSPHVAVDANGDFMVVWGGRDHPDGSDYGQGGVFARFFLSEGVAHQPEFRVNSYTTGYQGRPRIASHAGSLFVIVWTDYAQYQAQSQTRVFGALYDSFGGFVLEGTVATGRSADVAAGGANGQFVVVWSEYDDGFDVFAQVFSFGSLLGAPFKVNAYTTGQQTQPAVAANNDAFVVVWASQAGNFMPTTVAGQRFLGPDQRYGDEFEVTPGQILPDPPRVAVAANGKFAVTWTSYLQDLDGAGVFARCFDPSLSAGPQFQVNSTRAGEQRAAAIASPAASRFVVAWQSHDGGDYGVFGQRFAGDLSADPIFKDGFNSGP
jgi:hypothetical protein